MSCWSKNDYDLGGELSRAWGEAMGGMFIACRSVCQMAVGILQNVRSPWRHLKLVGRLKR